MTPIQYVLNRMSIKLTTLGNARDLARFYSETGHPIYVLRDRETEYYRPSVMSPELGDGFDTVETFMDGKVLEMAF